MLWYCLKCKEKTDSKNPRAVKTKNERIMLLLNCTVCASKNSRFIKEKEDGGLLGNLVRFLSKIPLVGLVLFLKIVIFMYLSNSVIVLFQV